LAAIGCGDVRRDDFMSRRESHSGAHKNWRGKRCPIACSHDIFAALGLAATALWQPYWMLQNVANHLKFTSNIVQFATFLISLIMGSPIAIRLAFDSTLALGLQLDLPMLMPTVGNTMFNDVGRFGFLTLPFFILAGTIVIATGLVRRLIDFAMLLCGCISGCLWQTNVSAHMLFGTPSGSGVAAVTAIGGIMTPVARANGYDIAMTTTLNAAPAP
jgi:hypothetical protein